MLLCELYCIALFLDYLLFKPTITDSQLFSQQRSFSLLPEVGNKPINNISLK